MDPDACSRRLCRLDWDEWKTSLSASSFQAVLSHEQDCVYNSRTHFATQLVALSKFHQAGIPVSIRPGAAVVAAGSRGLFLLSFKLRCPWCCAFLHEVRGVSLSCRRFVRAHIFSLSPYLPPPPPSPSPSSLCISRSLSFSLSLSLRLSLSHAHIHSLSLALSLSLTHTHTLSLSLSLSLSHTYTHKLSLSFFLCL